jgi:hypothetical protein
MKTYRLILLLALTFVLAPPSPRTVLARPARGSYSARLITPRAGEVLMPGQVVRVEWVASFPGVDLTMCEAEVLLSVDGGRTFTYVTEQRDPTLQHFNWTVPKKPTNAAVLDIRFGCLGTYPETSSVQLQSKFVIGGN